MTLVNTTTGAAFRKPLRVADKLPPMVGTLNVGTSKDWKENKMSKSGSSSSSGVGVCGLLGVAFVVLKLTGVINWSWWWVTCPFWGGLAVALAIVIVALPIILWLKR